MLNAQKNIRTQAMPCSMYFFANLLRQRSSPCPHITTTELKMYDERSPSYELLYPRVLVTDTNAHGSHVLLFGRAPQLAPLDARMTTAAVGGPSVRPSARPSVRPSVPWSFRLCAAVESFACLPFPAAHQDALGARARCWIATSALASLLLSFVLSGGNGR